MLKNEKCATYYDPWKYFIDAIEANDIVFLYRNTTGIPEIVDYEGDTDEEHYMNLNRFKILVTPLQASEITRLVGHEIKYNQTVISLTHRDGIDLWQNITKNCL
jgi:hypothetical protein